MKQPPLEIQKIEQVDNYTFVITWSDETMQTYRLSDLQEKCPCAQCHVDGKKIVVDKEVRAVKISSIGRYAMKIQYTSGCSKGIYTYAFLREMSLESKK